MIKNVIFDWSGTLSNDLRPVYEAAMYVFRDCGVREISFEEFRREIDYPYLLFYHKYIPELTRERADKIFTSAIHDVGEPAPYPGAAEVLATLHARGTEMVVLSGVPPRKILLEVQSYGFKHYFREVNGGVYDKTEVIHQVLERNGFAAAHTVYLGDMLHDVEAARLAGVRSAVSTWGYHPMARLKAASPDHFLEDLMELPNLLLSINTK